MIDNREVNGIGMIVCGCGILDSTASMRGASLIAFSRSIDDEHFWWLSSAMDVKDPRGSTHASNKNAIYRISIMLYCTQLLYTS